MAQLFSPLDGPLLDPDDRRAEVTKRMARDLRLLDAAGSEREAIVALMHMGYSAFDVARLADDARRLCNVAAVH
ncbi:hypothetical protein JQ633_12400 [Bradyrhizobium tropiciagri]|uniref:hypothetical protein n=1 Tax=Bradyrhizobium tropiciagri TaxID=312253 RepID=UPI001BA66D72|nr:hypothetical protein [Bradyrhizobium tropiciagri]MBR0871164.1 hypothetical protein [Bradyrhizobium tropiciagri]